MKTFPLHLAGAGLLLGLASTAVAQNGFVAATWTNAQIHTLDANSLNSLGSFAAGDSNPNGVATDGTTIWTAHFTTRATTFLPERRRSCLTTARMRTPTVGFAMWKVRR